MRRRVNLNSRRFLLDGGVTATSSPRLWRYSSGSALEPRSVAVVPRARTSKPASAAISAAVVADRAAPLEGSCGICGRAIRIRGFMRVSGLFAPAVEPGQETESRSESAYGRRFGNGSLRSDVERGGDDYGAGIFIWDDSENHSFKQCRGGGNRTTRRDRAGTIAECSSSSASVGG